MGSSFPTRPTPRAPLRGAAIRSIGPAWSHGPADVTLGLGLFLVFALVEDLLAPGHGQFHLGPALLEVQTQGHQGKAALRRLARELLDLPLMQEQLARPLGLDRKSTRLNSSH